MWYVIPIFIVAVVFVTLIVKKNVNITREAKDFCDYNNPITRIETEHRDLRKIGKEFGIMKIQKEIVPLILCDEHIQEMKAWCIRNHKNLTEEIEAELAEVYEPLAMAVINRMYNSFEKNEYLIVKNNPVKRNQKIIGAYGLCLHAFKNDDNIMDDYWRYRL